MTDDERLDAAREKVMRASLRLLMAQLAQPHALRDVHAMSATVLLDSAVLALADMLTEADDR